MKRSSWQLKAGSLKNMQITKGTLSSPADDEVQIAVKTIGLNFADIFAIWGLYGATPEGDFIPGLEYAGEVIAVGRNVHHLSPSQKVMGVTRFGAYTTALNIDARYVVPLPEGWTYDEGAAFLVQSLTAYHGLVRLGDLQKNQTVLIHSAAGGVGLQAVKICKKFSAYTIGTVGSWHKVALAQAEGYDAVIVRGRDFKNDLKKALNGRPLQIVMDSIGGQYFKIPFKMMAPMGRIIVYGSARYASQGNRPNYLKLLYYYWKRPKIDPQTLPEYNKSIMGFNLIWLYKKVDLLHEILGEIKALNLDKPHIGHRYEFGEMHEALLHFQSGKTTGKVIVCIN